MFVNVNLMALDFVLANIEHHQLKLTLIIAITHFLSHQDKQTLPSW